MTSESCESVRVQLLDLLDGTIVDADREVWLRSHLDLLGTYFFGDFGSGRIWTFRVVGGSVTEFTERTVELDPPGAMSICCISAFGEDAAGEIYIVERSSTTNSEIYKIVPVTPTIPPADFNCDGSVGILDLRSLLAQWGPCDGCLQDLDGDGQVGIFDLLTLLAQWG